MDTFCYDDRLDYGCTLLALAGDDNQSDLPPIDDDVDLDD